MKYIDYCYDPSMEAVKERNRLTNKHVITSARMWNERASGSREVSHGSMKLALEAYAEYRASEMWG